MSDLSWRARLSLSGDRMANDLRICTNKTTIFPKCGSLNINTIKTNGKWLKYDIITFYSWHVWDITLTMSQNIIWLPNKFAPKLQLAPNHMYVMAARTVLVLIKLTKFAVALRLRCGSCKLIFCIISSYFL